MQKEVKMLKQVKENRRNGKIIVPFFVALFLFFLFLLFDVVVAQEVEFYWCIETKTGNICQPNVLSEQCNGNIYLTRPQACEPVDCIIDGICQKSVPRKVCEDAGGKAISEEESAQQCATGCCIIAGKNYGVITKSECELIAAENKMIQYMDFNESIKSEAVCSAKTQTYSKGCCFTSNFDCVYTTRESCVAPYFVNKYCSEIPECNAIKHFKQGCGNVNLGNNFDICWFDSKGNQEECVSCGYPAYICSICRDNSCYDEKRKLDVNKFQPYCKSTKCDLSDAKGSQVLKWENGKMKIEWKQPPKTLLSGDSICYNFYTGMAKVGEEVFDNGFPRRSMGLQNQVVRCSLGEIEIDGLGVDRNKLCFEKNGKTYVERNRYYNCMKCGKPITKMERYQEEIQKKQQQIDELQQELQKMMEEKGIGDITTLLSNFPELLEKYQQIEKLQKEIEELTEKMDLEDYEIAAAFFINMPDSWADYYTQGSALLPGFATAKAAIFYALGGAKCTKDNCESQKFSNGESYCIWRSETGKSEEWLAHTFWSPTDTACVPRYPPGGCMGCGGTGDTDRCNEPEAWAAGDCIFEPLPKEKKTAFSIVDFISLYSTTRFNLIPWYSAASAFAYCSGVALPAYFGCWWWWFKTKIWMETGLYTIIELGMEIVFASVIKGITS